MYELKVIKKLWLVWIFICFFILSLNLYFPRLNRAHDFNVLIFFATGFLMIFFWYLICIFVFSTLGIYILQSTPKYYVKENFKYLFFIKIFTSKNAYEKISHFIDAD